MCPHNPTNPYILIACAITKGRCESATFEAIRNVFPKLVFDRHFCRHHCAIAMREIPEQLRCGFTLRASTYPE